MIVLHGVGLYICAREGYYLIRREGINATVIFVYTNARSLQSRLEGLFFRDFGIF
jgi:hypothetical protein